MNTLAENHIILAKAFKVGDVEEVKRIIRRHTEKAKCLGQDLMGTTKSSIKSKYPKE